LNTLLVILPTPGRAIAVAWVRLSVTYVSLFVCLAVCLSVLSKRYQGSER